jgi:hypothetical protein
MARLGAGCTSYPIPLLVRACGTRNAAAKCSGLQFDTTVQAKLGAPVTATPSFINRWSCTGAQRVEQLWAGVGKRGYRARARTYICP